MKEMRLGLRLRKQEDRFITGFRAFFGDCPVKCRKKGDSIRRLFSLAGGLIHNLFLTEHGNV